MGSLKDLHELVQIILKDFFDDRVPTQIADLVTFGLLLSVVAAVLFGLFIAFGNAVKVFREDIRPLFYNEEERRRAEKRRRFADHIESEIRRIDNAEEWGDYKFAELEAEVEAEGQRHGLLFAHKRSGLRREKSLSRALRNSKERLILLEGDPGSGKSVALRYLTTTLARIAMKARTTSAVIPLYINLKNIERKAGVKVDANLIRSHVMQTLNRPNTRNITEFLDEEFDRGMRDGTWLFLFDSFDEIPDVLSATSADTVIRDYANAIADFLLTLNRCRGIVASRYFRGPGGLAWPRFRILVLSDAYRRNLIRRTDLTPATARALIGDIELTQGDLNLMSRNPMFLGLLCEYMHMGRPFPENAYVVFESYVTSRLERDESRLQKRFGTSAAVVRTAAEQAAFCMASEAGLGLSPSRVDLAAAMKSRGFRDDATIMLDAIEYIKLARSDEHDHIKTFTFAHRRFQEYFATCVVIKEPELVPPSTLLTDARWRETAVVLLQTHTNLTSLLVEAERRLGSVVDEIESAISEVPPLAEIERHRQPKIQLPWPPLTLHLLGLLQSAFRGRPEQLPARIRELAGRIVMAATWTGSLSDRRWVLEVAEPAPQDVLTFALRRAYRDGSTWLGDAAYRQAGALREIPPDIATEIRRALIGQFMGGRLRAQRHSTRAFLLRLPGGTGFVNVQQLLLVLWPVDATLCVILAAAMLWGRMPWPVTAILLITVLPWFRYVDARSPTSFVIALLYMRFGTILAAVWLPPSQSDGAMWLRQVVANHGVLQTPLVWMFIIPMLWGPMAFVAAEAGRLVHPGMTPFLSLYPLIRIVQAARSYRVWFAIGRLKPSKKLLQAIAVTALLIAIVGLMIKAMVMFTVVRYGVGAVLSLTAATGFAFLAVQSVNDIKALVRHRRRQGAWSVTELLDAAEQIRDEGRRARFIRFVRERAAVAPSGENEALLRKHALSLENSTLGRQTAVIDELNLLAEQMRAQRATAGAHAASSPVPVPITPTESSPADAPK